MNRRKEILIGIAVGLIANAVGTLLYILLFVDMSIAETFKAAAEQGFPDAAFNLALMYDQGDGVEQNPNEAARWYFVAAEKGNPQAQYNLGLKLQAP